MNEIAMDFRRAISTWSWSQEFAKKKTVYCTNFSHECAVFGTSDGVFGSAKEEICGMAMPEECETRPPKASKMTGRGWSVTVFLVSVIASMFLRRGRGRGGQNKDLGRLRQASSAGVGGSTLGSDNYIAPSSPSSIGTVADGVKIPEWASGEPLRKILDSQSGGPNLQDPEDIFPEFSTSIPDNIFDEEPIRDRRGSSGDWDGDPLTISEKLAYKRAMGFK